MPNFDMPNEINIKETEDYKVFTKEFDYYIDFFNSLSELIFDCGPLTTFFTTSNFYHLDTSLVDNSVQTLKSIKLCCSIGSFADANILIRKLRDDLLLYVYIIDIINNRQSFLEDPSKMIDTTNAETFASSFLKLRLNNKLTEDEKAIEAWFGNSVNKLSRSIKSKLSFENFMKHLKKNENISRILTEYSLQNYWERLRNKLNDYVHNNGKQFTCQNFIHVHDEHLSKYLININIRTSYVSSFFLVLLLMVDSTLIRSSDLVDYFDCDMKPPEDCQYLIAPFVQEFIDTKVSMLHPELKKYLKDNNINGMRIE